MNKILCVILLFLSVFINSCSFLNIDKKDSLHSNESIINVKDYSENNSSLITGRISASKEIKQRILIIACSVKPSDLTKKYIFSYIILGGPKEYMIYLPEGEYFLYAEADLNNNMIFDETEIVGFYGNPDKISIGKNEIRTGIDIKLNELKFNGTVMPEKYSINYNYNSIEYTSENGQIKKIYSEIFSANNAKMGWWYPSLFMQAFGANIYLTSEYDPKKIPVLFVHGAQGSPQDWVYYYIRLDKNKYQPFFFYYPSGMRIQILSQLLYIKITDLQKKYHFKKIYLAAHSMGGLLTRSMLTDYYNEKSNLINLYITFATPWSGFEFADAALKTAPYVLPSWVDVSSHSMFIKNLLDKKIPLSIDYYLFFGKYDKTAKGRALDERAYTNAKGVYGFNADHNGILSDRPAFIKFNEILTLKTFSH